MDRTGFDGEMHLLRDFIRWYYYDGSVGGLEGVIKDNQYIVDIEKRYLDLLEKRA